MKSENLKSPAAYLIIFLFLTLGSNAQQSLLDYPDIVIKPLFGACTSEEHISENSVFIHPVNPAIAFNANNYTCKPGSPQFSISGFITSNTGNTWSGSTNIGGHADPSAVIDLQGNYYTLSTSGSSLPPQNILFSADGINWSTSQIIATNSDKGHLWIDNNTSSSFVNNLYAGWTDFTNQAAGQIFIGRSNTSNVNSWTNIQNVSSTITPIPQGGHHAVNLKTGPNGEVYFGGHITPQLSVFMGTTFAGSAGLDLYKRISNKLYLKTEILYAFQQGQVIPYWIKFSDTGGFVGYEKWSLLKVPLTINYFRHKPESKIIYYPSIGIEQVFHLKQFNNCGYDQWSSSCHYSVINIYGIMGVGAIYNISQRTNFFFEVRIEHNITNIAPIPDDVRDRSNRRTRENNMVAGITIGVLLNYCNKQN